MSFYEGKRVLVTGANGFIGSHLTERLLKEGAHVSIFEKADDENGARQRLIAGLAGNESKFIQIIKGDIGDVKSIQQIADNNPDIIFHLAAIAFVDYSFKHPDEVTRVNLQGTINVLEAGKFCNAERIVCTSSSEVYGCTLKDSGIDEDHPFMPQHPYGASKVAADRYCFAYHQSFGTPVTIIRPFNSILETEKILFFYNGECLHMPVKEAWNKFHDKQIEVPCFNEKTKEVHLQKISAFIREPVTKPCYNIDMKFGKSVQVTEDHSIFILKNKKIKQIKAKDLKVKDKMVCCKKLPFIEKDTKEINFSELICEKYNDDGLVHYRTKGIDPLDFTLREFEDIQRILGNRSKRRFDRWNKIKRTKMIPIFLLNNMNKKIGKCKISAFSTKNYMINNLIPIDKDVLWFLGLFLAEGCSKDYKNGNYHMSLCSDKKYLIKAKKIAIEKFGIEMHLDHREGKAPVLRSTSKCIFDLIDCLGFNYKSHFCTIPPFILRLPLNKLKHFLEGYWCGDGNHGKKKDANEILFTTVSEKLASELVTALSRFGIVSAKQKYDSWIDKKIKKYFAYRVSAYGINVSPKHWCDPEFKQTIQSPSGKDLVFVNVKKITKLESKERMVYDLSVPNYENFYVNDGVFCHNTYGPRHTYDMPPKFMSLALRNEPITIYGDGTQCRDLTYVSDMVEAFMLMGSTPGIEGEAINVGTGDTYSVNEVAKLIKQLSNSDSEITHIEKRIGEVKCLRANNTKAKRLLGWEPKVSIEEGLKKNIEWMRSVLQ